MTHVKWHVAYVYDAPSRYWTIACVESLRVLTTSLRPISALTSTSNDVFHLILNSRMEMNKIPNSPAPVKRIEKVLFYAVFGHSRGGEYFVTRLQRIQISRK